MNTQHCSILICRGIGVILILLCVFSVAPTLVSLSRRDAIVELSAPRSETGWTSYAPAPPPQGGPTSADYVVALGRILGSRMPFVLAGLSGAVFLLCSRPFGRLLARGLADPIG